MDAKTIIGLAGAIGTLITILADAMGEPVATVRKRVLAQVEHDARDQTDETDDLLDLIDGNLPGPPEPPEGASDR